MMCGKYEMCHLNHWVIYRKPKTLRGLFYSDSGFGILIYDQTLLNNNHHVSLMTAYLNNAFTIVE